MSRLVRLALLAAIGWAFVTYMGRAWDQELASAGSVLSERAEQPGDLDAEMGQYTARSESAPQDGPPVVKHTSSADVVQGKSAVWWARRAIQNGKNARARGRTIRRLKRELAHTYAPSFEHYFTIAARAYGVSRATLEHRGRCESVNFTDFYNDTPIYNGEHAQGVMGFIPSTFNSTPYAGLNLRYDHLANIMAGAWMEARGRGGEWAPVCR